MCIEERNTSEILIAVLPPVHLVFVAVRCVSASCRNALFAPHDFSGLATSRNAENDWL
jgi:hypothetical protein